MLASRKSSGNESGDVGAQRAHLLYATDGSGADLSAVDAGLAVDPRTGSAAPPAATSTTPLQLVCTEGNVGLT